MGNIKNFAERNKEFEQAHYSCKELLEDRIQKIENFVSKWLMLAVAGVVLLQTAGFTYFYFELIHLRKKVDHRYFQIEDMLEDINKVKIENGRVLREYNTKD